ncbi:hypothetical protein E4T43_07295 [Aureobasidium subglaciale]|nr:hypothetical protein E4T43_07295 [Aureobasidium subglaciale]
MPSDSTDQMLSRLEASLMEEVHQLRVQEAKLKANTESWSALVHLKDTLRAGFPDFGEPIDLGSPESADLIDCNYLLVQNDIHTARAFAGMKENYKEIKKILDRAQLIVDELAESDSENHVYSEMVKVLRGVDGLVEPRADWEILIKKLAALITHAGPIVAIVGIVSPRLLIAPLYPPQSNAMDAVTTTKLKAQSTTPPLTSPITLSKDTTPATTLSRDTTKPIVPKISDEHIHKVDILKEHRKQKLDELVTTQAQVNKHLTDSCDHNLQITQLRLVFGAGNSVIRINDDGSINACNLAKIALASELLDHDKKLVESLSAFNKSQKKYFELIKEMKEIEMEIQKELTLGNGDDDEMNQEEDVEFRGSQVRFAMLEQYRVQMTETWLEWLDELA